MKILGRHLLVEYADCEKSILDDMRTLEKVLTEAVKRSGATIVRSVFHRYAPQGISGVIVIAESHLSIHTWPEYGYASVDLFTCGELIDPYKAHEYLKKALSSGRAQVREMKRGIPSSTDEMINHKPGLPARATAR